MRSYATPERVAEATKSGEYPDGLEVTDAEIERASAAVDYLTRYATFDADAEGYPVDPVLGDALERMTIATLQWWEETDDPTGARSQEGLVKILSVSMGSSAGSESRRDPGAARHAVEAFEIGRVAGLVGARVRVR